MNTWIRANHDFGLPCLRLVVPLRSEVGATLMRRLSTTDDPELIAKTCKEVIVSVRPSLINCSVISMFMRNFGSLEIAVFDASLPKVKAMEAPQEVLLEPCPICHRNIQANGHLWNKFVGNRCVIVCSQECCDKSVEHDDIRSDVIAATKPRLKKYHDNNIPKLKKHDGEQTFNATTLTKQEWLGLPLNDVVDKGKAIREAMLKAGEQVMNAVALQPGAVIRPRCQAVNPDNKQCERHAGHADCHKARGDKCMLVW